MIATDGEEYGSLYQGNKYHKEVTDNNFDLQINMA